MKDLYQALNTILEKKIELYDRLIHIFGEEWNAVTEYSRDRLLKTLEQKETLLMQVGELNQKREAILKKMSEHWGIPVEKVTLRKIAQFKNNPWSMSMILCQQRMKEQIAKIKKLNTMNRRLIERSSLSMQDSVHSLYKADTRYTPYHADGKVGNVPLTRGLISTNI
ncbi:flagellar protein FlgN [Nitrospina watsonii]|uniref:Flagella synthesis protein FlgN n=1 Tax=Nitrospina watsonii TaxID=1323948 RepID=A0ABM9HAI0_9BACT|nr:flagellar protein FlgN [Nitrospina watsonii]CAI2717140.1 conserved protein of unknown function [Nitrospina watsonii]